MSYIHRKWHYQLNQGGISGCLKFLARALVGYEVLNVYSIVSKGGHFKSELCSSPQSLRQLQEAVAKRLSGSVKVITMGGQLKKKSL